MKKPKGSIFKRFFVIGIIALIIIVIFIIAANKIIIRKSAFYITDNFAKLPDLKCALVLGTSKKLNNGNDNPYFTYRIQAAYDLYKNGKIKYIIVSGDNSRESYNEPQDMNDALVKLGIPENIIIWILRASELLIL